MIERAKVLILSSLLWVAAITTVVERCLNNNQASFIFDGSPSPTTPLLLKTLKKLNTTAVFAIDPHKINVGGSGQLLKNIVEDGHILGLSLSNDAELNTMSNVGLRGTLENISEDIANLVGKKPLLIKVPRTTAQKKVALLEAMGYLVIMPDLDLGSSQSGQCLSQFETRVNEKSLWDSPIISISDTGTGCDGEEISKMISFAREHQLNMTRLDTCIGLERPYKTTQDLENLTLPNLPDPVAKRPITTSIVQEKALKNSAPVTMRKLYEIYLVGFLLFWFIN